MTENKFDLLTAKVDEESKKIEAVAILTRRFAEVIENEGLGFDEAYGALSAIYFLMSKFAKESPKAAQ